MRLNIDLILPKELCALIDMLEGVRSFNGKSFYISIRSYSFAFKDIYSINTFSDLVLIFETTEHLADDNELKNALIGCAQYVNESNATAIFLLRENRRLDQVFIEALSGKSIQHEFMKDNFQINDLLDILVNSATIKSISEVQSDFPETVAIGISDFDRNKVNIEPKSLIENEVPDNEVPETEMNSLTKFDNDTTQQISVDTLINIEQDITQDTDLSESPLRIKDFGTGDNEEICITQPVKALGITQDDIDEELSPEPLLITKRTLDLKLKRNIDGFKTKSLAVSKTKLSRNKNFSILDLYISICGKMLGIIAKSIKYILVLASLFIIISLIYIFFNKT